MEGKAAGLVRPLRNTETMHLHLTVIARNRRLANHKDDDRHGLELSPRRRAVKTIPLRSSFPAPFRLPATGRYLCYEERCARHGSSVVQQGKFARQCASLKRFASPIFSRSSFPCARGLNVHSNLPNGYMDRF
jgi:hypothetical protein